jgi:Ca2+-binding RTX toxin-like protein
LDLGSSQPSLYNKDARTFAVTGGGAEVGTTVEIRLSRANATPVTYRAIPDNSGRFAVQVDAAALGAGQVSIAARDVDVAGNASTIVTSQVTVNETTTENVIAGVANADEFVGGTVGADVFVAGAQAGQDYFIGGTGFDVLRVSGAQSDYTLSFVPETQRAAHQAILQGGSILLQGGLPLVRLARNTSAANETFFFQAEAVEFTDGTVRIAPQAVIAAGAGNLAGAAGDDRLFAGNGGAQLSGGAGNDVLVGGTGPDRLRNPSCSNTTQGSTLIGGEGADVLEIAGSASCDEGLVKAYGGAGPDRFEILAAAGFDLNVVIADLRPGEDRIDLTTLRILQSGTPRPLGPADLNLEALSQALASQGRAEIDLSRFVAADGAPLDGVLRIELSPYAAPALRQTDFVLSGS